jgi:hypothetical protein
MEGVDGCMSFSNFPDTISKIKSNDSDIIDEKQIKIETLEIATYSDNDDNIGNLQNSDTVFKKIGECNILVICIGFSRINEINTLFRSKGLYSELTMKKDLSDLHEKLIQFEHPQNDFIQEYANIFHGKKPQHVLVAGCVGSGETDFLSQLVSIRISEMEQNKKSYRVIVLTDSASKDCHLLKTLESRHLKFIETEINEKRRKIQEETIDVKFTTLRQLMIKYNILPSTPQDQEIMKSLITKEDLLTNEGWLSWKDNPPSVSNALHASTEVEVPEYFNEAELLKELNQQSNFKDKVTLEWLQSELGQFFLPKDNADLIAILRSFRQNWLLDCFWKEYWAQNAPIDTCCSLLSFKLERLVSKVQEEEHDKETIFMLNLFKLDYGKSGFPKNGSIDLRWKPKSYKNMNLFVSVESNSWQDFKLIKEERNPSYYRGIMTIVLDKNFHNCDEVNNLISEKFNSRAFHGFNKTFDAPPPSGQKPLWISTDTLANDSLNFLPILSEATKNFMNVIWTCYPSIDSKRYNQFCENAWKYVNINQISDMEAPCVVIFGMPAKESLSMTANLSMLFSRARSCLVLITEANFLR